MINDKHAYLIIAHNEPKVLATLFKCIDDRRNDVYLHIDKKSKQLFDEFLNFKLKHSKVIVLTNRIDVRWGSFSQVLCELLLMRTARENGDYRYYHLLSGVDLPIKSQNYIHEFFGRTNKNFIGLANGDCAKEDVRRKMYNYNLFYSYRKSNFILRNLTKILRFTFNFFLCHTFKRPFDMEYKKGANWFSITQPLVNYILENEKFIKSRFKYTFCADEIFIQSLVWNNTGWRKTLYSLDDEFEGCMRLIDWNRGKPYVWTTSDLDELTMSDRLFARKFSSQHMDVVDWIKDTFSKTEEQ